jgi:hypothetical protein
VIACHAALAESPTLRQRRFEKARATVRASSWDNAASRIRQLMEQAAVRAEETRPSGVSAQISDVLGAGGAAAATAARLDAAY